jgi:hypothetical protein
LPASAPAQGRFGVTPSLAVSQVYDSNLFSRPSAQERDLVSRFTPGIEARYRFRPAALRMSYAFDGEVYPQHHQLDSARARQDAAVALEHARVMSLGVAASASYSTTQRPGELNLTTGLDSGRRAARRFVAGPSLSRRLGRRATGELEYTFTSDAISGGAEIRTQAARLGVERRMSPRSVGRLSLSLRRFSFSDGGRTTARILSLGWDRQLGRRLSLELDLGPRASEGRIGPEASVSLHHRSHHGELSLAYAQTETTAVGEAGAVTAENVTASFGRELFRPLRVSVGPSVWRSRRGGLEVMVYRAVVDATYRLARRVSLVGSYQYSLQRGSLTGAVVGDIPHNLFLLRLSTAAGS